MMKNYNFFESEEESIHKKEVLAKLSEIIEQWSYQVALKEKQPESVARKIKAKLFTFGSYYLNVDTNDGDIDMVCVVPKLIKREEHFFQDLYELLRSNPKVKEIVQVTAAKVPILKMEFERIQVDISFAQLDTQTIEDDLNLTDNNLLINMDEKSCQSLNGRRVADQILKAVPNADHFRQTLRMIKLWAKNKGIYSNVMGYLGGVSWAIMTAKVCQLFPTLVPFRLFKLFFEVYSQWDWQNVSVKLYEILDLEDNPRNSENWQGKPEDMQKGKMFIITPSFPCMNSSHMITESSLTILKDLIAQANIQIKNFELQTKTYLLNENQQLDFWNSFFSKLDFFNLYEQFIQIDILGNDQSDFKLWLGHIESKVRRLQLFFEKQYEQFPPLINIFDFHLLPFSFSKTDKQFPLCRCYFYGIKLKDSINFETKFIADFKLPVSFFVKSLIEDKFFHRKKSTQNLRIFQTKRDQFRILNNEVYLKQQGVNNDNNNNFNKKMMSNNNEQKAEKFEPISSFEPQIVKKSNPNVNDAEQIHRDLEMVKKESIDSNDSLFDKF